MELPITPLVVTVLLLVPLTLYILQRPIPSIPHAPWAVLTTDLPALIAHPTTGFAYLKSLPTTHQTPLRQVWLKPFSRPYLLLADYREARDILTRRREWDRSDYSISILGGVAPRHHINLKHGPAWRYHRALLADTMAPAFLHAVAAPEIYRSATALCDRDTTVLGRAVPKGTTMLMLAQGPSLTSPALRIPEAARSPSARPCGEWDPEGMELFAPERWLSTDGAGNVVFDPLAGPVLGFGGGVRGCFGRKLAYLEMRIVCTLIAWDFELLECGEELSGYEATEEITYKPTSCYMKPRRWEDA
ncbi:Protein artemis [Verticillium dahliae VDG2]|nr:Protein artemis [Verticillium dahliae VDG2]